MGHPQPSQLPQSAALKAQLSKLLTVQSALHSPEVTRVKPVSVAAVQAQQLSDTNQRLRSNADANARHLAVCREELARCMDALSKTHAQLDRARSNIQLLHAELALVDAPERSA